jgi:2Fe-2S ferredoxin
MPRAILKAADGTVHRIEAAESESLMRAAVRHGIEGIVAECGGECACATCHVYVDERFYGMLQPPSATECELLDFVAAERKTTSRLSCQIRLVAKLDGIEVTLPDRQV